MLNRRALRLPGAARRGAVPIALLCASVALAGCSKGGDEESKGATTTSTTRPAATASTAPPTTLDNAAYSKFVATTLDKINKAGTDPCRVAVVFQDLGQGPEPRTAPQGQQAVDLVVRLFEAVAGASGPENAADAKLVTAGAERIAAEARKNDYDPDWIAKNANETLGGEGLAALQRLVTATSKKCQTPGGGAPAGTG